MKPPSDLDATSKRLWSGALAALKAQGTWKDTDAPVLEDWVRSRQRARDARKVSDTEPFVSGSMGQLVPHPAVKLAREAELDAHRYAEALLLTPQTRRRAGVDNRQEEEDLSDLGIS